GAWNFNQKYYTMITKSDNIDLYCALRNFSVLVQRVGNKHYNFYIHDIFNFKMEAYDDFMITIVNNWAYLCMFAGALREIHVNISFSRSALK
ncbi:MAG: hypothetical protein IKZ82_12505, partial [Clostridia bacterium]|nr:hypothetical protein [Clostridia bacterium]